jgi:hypothetical protein
MTSHTAAPWRVEAPIVAEVTQASAPQQDGLTPAGEIRLPCYGITICLDRNNSRHQPGCGTITSDLKEAGSDAKSIKFNAAIDGLESLILAHACAGIDVTSPAYVEGIETTVEAIGNNL